ncbi:hypothetical protein [Capnocytophaga sputigena]|jgi:hypothetical protein|uniref:hypothetical protein n=1 Tax=Capnocytophaga sputigena TaxID=1019 RepID=UPI0028D6184D|nr:hypothetical protein [Capnocytophaga sputigena]
MMLDKLFFNKITPYNRSFINVQLTEDRVVTLPAVNTAVFFLSNGDIVSIDDYEFMDKLPFIDYQLIASDKTLTAELNEFKVFVKNQIFKFNIADFRVINKQIINNNVMIVLAEQQFVRDFQQKEEITN